MAYLGRHEIDDLLTFPANTHTAATGAATDADSVPSYRVYEDETTTPILTGSMALLDGSNTVGLYSEQITLSAANGFEVGKCYTIYISATVATVVGTMAHTFQVEAAPATATALATVDGNVDTLVASITTVDAVADAVWDEASAGHVTAGSFGEQVKTDIDAILVDTGTDIPATLATIAGYLDTEVATTLAAVDTEVAAIKVVTDALTSAGAAKLALSAGTIVIGAAAAGTLSTTAMTTNLTEATDDHYNGRIVIWTSGVLINQATDITDYNGTTKTLTFTAVTEAPTAADTFIIV